MLVPISMGTNTAAGNRKKTSGVHFCQKRGLFSLLNIRNFRQMFLLTVTLFRMLKISGRVILKCTGQLWHGRPPDVTHNEISEIETLLISKKNARHRAKELYREIVLGNLSLKKTKISFGLSVLILEFLVTSSENQEYIFL